MRKRTSFALITGIMTLLAIAFLYTQENPLDLGHHGEVHEHAAFMIYVDGESLDFAQKRYMVRDRHVHIEDMDGTTIHKHAEGMTLGYFLTTLGYIFEEGRLVLDDGSEYIDNGPYTLKFYVNEEKNPEYGSHEIKEGERYLISYGSESEEEIARQLDSVPESHG